MEVTRDSYLFQQVFDPTTLNLVFTSELAIVDNLHVREHFSTSDHNSITLELVCETCINTNEIVKYAFRKGNWKEMKNELALVCWLDILGDEDINIMWNKFVIYYQV